MARGSGRGLDDMARLRRILLNAYGFDRGDPSYFRDYQRICRELKNLDDLQTQVAIARTRRLLDQLLGGDEHG